MTLEIKENEILANHCTFRIGGPARYFIVVKSKEELTEAIEFAGEEGLPFFVFGGGSNILFRDSVCNGVAIKISNSDIRISDSGATAGAGVFFSKLINFSMDNGLTGLEWGFGIPGTAAGAVAGNAGAYGHSISEFVKSVTVLDMTSPSGASNKIKNYSAEECEFVYRGSRFKKHDNREIILEIEFNLEKGDREKSKKIIQEIMEKRKGAIVPYPSAGCVFKNLKSETLNPESIPKEKIKGGKVPAAYFIEQCGLKGKQIGGAKIAEEHCNYIVNAGGAKADDVLALIELCKQKVREKFHIDLEEEIVVI